MPPSQVRVAGPGVRKRVCLFSLFLQSARLSAVCLSRTSNRQTGGINSISVAGLSLQPGEWSTALLQEIKKKKKKPKHPPFSASHSQLNVSAADTSIPLMLYPWHDWRHVIVGQMADYTNPHYSSWWGWNLDHMNLVFHFLLLSSVWNEFSHYLSPYNPLSNLCTFENPLFPRCPCLLIPLSFLSAFLNY